MKNVTIGRNVKQPTGYSCFIPHPFPPSGMNEISNDLLMKAARAERLIGKLDGVTHTLPDANFFITMYVYKDATNSSQIEGTQATMLDALELEAGINNKSTDANDILGYIKALHFGIDQLKHIPFSLRLIRGIHKVLMTDARSTHFSDPGEFRRSQNWIGGSNLANASYVPPPLEEMKDCLRDLEKFIHNETLIPVIHSGILHAQFETIHPFLDGNGRTGRLMISLFLYERQLLEKPVLFLSSYFKKHQKAYYEKLDGYHKNQVREWLDFFLDAVIETAEESIAISKKITTLVDDHMAKVQAMGKREAQSSVNFLRHLFRTPVVTSASVAKMTGFTRPGAQKVIDRFIALGILIPRDVNDNYGRLYTYQKYIEIFQ